MLNFPPQWVHIRRSYHCSTFSMAFFCMMPPPKRLPVGSWLLVLDVKAPASPLSLPGWSNNHPMVTGNIFSGRQNRGIGYPPPPENSPFPCRWTPGENGNCGPPQSCPPQREMQTWPGTFARGGAGFVDQPVSHVQVVGGGPDHPPPPMFWSGCLNPPPDLQLV